MYDDGRRWVDKGLFTIVQPLVRWIRTREGSGKNIGFGPQVNASLTEGYIRVGPIDFNVINTANLLE